MIGFGFMKSAESENFFPKVVYFFFNKGGQASYDTYFLAGHGHE